MCKIFIWKQRNVYVCPFCQKPTEYVGNQNQFFNREQLSAGAVLGMAFLYFLLFITMIFHFPPWFFQSGKFPMIFDIDYFEHVDVLRHYWYSAECTKYCIWAMLSLCTAESAKNTFRDNRIRMHNKIYNLIIQNFCISSRFETLKVFSLVKINFSIELSQVIL